MATVGDSRPDGFVVIQVGFNEKALAQNSILVPAAIAAMRNLKLVGGRGVLFNGPVSVPIAMALAHAVSHLYEFVGCWDPKLKQYVVAISHAASPRPGDLIP